MAQFFICKMETGKVPTPSMNICTVLNLGESREGSKLGFEGEITLDFH